jgi:hypothetical protein
LGLGLILPHSPAAGGSSTNSRFVELRIFSPVNYKKFGAAIQQAVSGSVLKTYTIEYQYPNASLRVVGMDIKSVDNKIYYIHMAPSDLFIEKGFELHPNDNVIVVGALMNLDQHPVLIASVVSKGEQSIKLRTDQGVPMWTSGSQLGRFQMDRLEN